MAAVDGLEELESNRVPIEQKATSEQGMHSTAWVQGQGETEATTVQTPKETRVDDSEGDEPN